MYDLVPGGSWNVTNANATVTSAGVVTGVSTGIDTVQYAVTSACGSDTARYLIYIVSPTACGTLMAHNIVRDSMNIFVFPNPTAGSFTVQIPELAENVSLFVTDIYGQEILRNVKNNNTDSLIQINLPDVARGIYVLKIVANGKSYVQNLVIAW